LEADGGRGTLFELKRFLYALGTRREKTCRASTKTGISRPSPETRTTLASIADHTGYRHDRQIDRTPTIGSNQKEGLRFHEPRLAFFKHH
jgi:hypothetical protein